MDGHHPDTKLRGGGHGSGDLMRDVVELQVEKHPVTLLDQAPDERRPLGREESAADLGAADSPPQAERELGGVDGVVDVEGD